MERSVETSMVSFISVGSNIGEKLENCRKGIAEIKNLDQTTLLGQSGFYRTSPVDYMDQDWFVNAAVKIRTRMSPIALLHALQKIQKKIGRKKGGIRFGPRILDLDIIFYDLLIMDTKKLVLPHPRMHKRAFVLKPICDIDQKVIHPVLQMDVKTLLDGLNDNDQEIHRI